LYRAAPSAVKSDEVQASPGDPDRVRRLTWNL
jgi:hypothetical protein